MKCLFAALCLLWAGAVANAAADLTGPIGGGGPGFGVVGLVGSAGAPPPSYTGPGDVVSGATAFYSCSRAYNATYATSNGKLCNIVRASDSEVCDELAASTGGPGITANCTGADNGKTLAVWLAATTGAITEWYDQTGNGFHALQATAAQQWTLSLSCINSLPCGQFSTSQSSGYSSSGSFTPSGIDSFSAVADRTTFAAVRIAVAGVVPQNTANQLAFTNSANSWTMTGGSSATVTANDAVWHAANTVIDGASPATFFNIDGTVTTASITGATVARNLGFGVGGGTGAAGNFAESAVWDNVAFSTTQATNLCRNQQAYYGAGNFGASC